MMRFGQSMKSVDLLAHGSLEAGLAYTVSWSFTITQLTLC